MPVIRNVHLCLSVEQVLHHQGISCDYKLQPFMMDIVQELMTNMGDLLAPAFAYELHRTTCVGTDQLCLEDGTVFHGSSLMRFLARARQLAVVVCTIGPYLEERVANYFSRDERLRGLVLDHIGTMALDSLVIESCQHIRREASSQGYKASGPLSPGQLDWSVYEQWHLFQLVPAEQIGVHLTKSGMMVPLKSVSMVIGIGAEMTTWTRAEICTRCSLKKICHYRHTPDKNHNTMT